MEAKMHQKCIQKSVKILIDFWTENGFEIEPRMASKINPKMHQKTCRTLAPKAPTMTQMAAFWRPEWISK